jgi:hypothetical protein
LGDAAGPVERKMSQPASQMGPCCCLIPMLPLTPRRKPAAAPSHMGGSITMPLRRQPRGHNEGMHAELLTIPGCPHGVPARELFTRALELEGADPGLLTVREIATDADAAAASFHGSPTFTIDGKDLFPSNAAPAVTCRVYPGQHGMAGQPTLESLREAIRTAGPRDRPGT